MFDYRDVKFNVSIEYGGIKLVGEIQFLLSFMLKAKKIGHSVYSFVRNEFYYKEISNYLKYKMNDSILNRIILSRNISLLSNMEKIITTTITITTATTMTTIMVMTTMMMKKTAMMMKMTMMAMVMMKKRL